MGTYYRVSPNAACSGTNEVDTLLVAFNQSLSTTSQPEISAFNQAGRWVPVAAL